MSEDERSKIEKRAHEIWEREGRPEGKDLENWNQAAAEIAHEAEGTAGKGAREPVMPVVGAEEEQVSSAAAEGVDVPSERAKDPSVRETQEGELAKKTSNEGMWTTTYEAGEQARPEGKPGHVILFGFDRLMRMLENSMQWSEAGNGYPPYNIEITGDDRYRITLAVAGFDENELAVKVRENVLLVGGRKREAAAATAYLYRRIAGRSFKRQFQLADFVKVVSAHLHNGLLIIDLVRELPEAMKPRRIEISTSAGRETICWS